MGHCLNATRHGINVLDEIVSFAMLPISLVHFAKWITAIWAASIFKKSNKRQQIFSHLTYNKKAGKMKLKIFTLDFKIYFFTYFY